MANHFRRKFFFSFRTCHQEIAAHRTLQYLWRPPAVGAHVAVVELRGGHAVVSRPLSGSDGAAAGQDEDNFGTRGLEGGK